MSRISCENYNSTNVGLQTKSNYILYLRVSCSQNRTGELYTVCNRSCRMAGTASSSVYTKLYTQPQSYFRNENENENEIYNYCTSF